MPGAIRTPARATKRSKSSLVKKKYRTSQRPVKVSLGRQVLPKQLFNTLTYASTQYILTVTVGFGKYLFSCNGMFDPDITGTGTQPLYFDQLSALYDHYTVLRSRIKVELVYASTIAVNQQCLCVYVDDDTTVAGNVDSAIMRPDAKYVVNNGQQLMKPVYHSWSAADTFGPNPQADPNLQGTSSANPTEQSYYAIILQDFGNLTYNANFVVKIEYDVVWDELATVATS